jgi:hypothetical protein
LFFFPFLVELSALPHGSTTHVGFIPHGQCLEEALKELLLVTGKSLQYENKK